MVKSSSNNNFLDALAPSVDLSIIIVNWHSANYVISCLRSIYEHTSAMSYEVIVVDNACFDGCRERLAREYPGGGSSQETRSNFSMVLMGLRARAMGTAMRANWSSTFPKSAK